MDFLVSVLKLVRNIPALVLTIPGLLLQFLRLLLQFLLDMASLARHPVGPKYAWTVALRYLWRRRVTVLAIISITALVTAYVVIMSVLNGFAEYLYANVRKTNAHVEVDRPSVTGLTDYEALGDRIVASDERVLAWTPMIQGVVLVQTSQYRHWAILRGLDLQRETDVEKLRGETQGLARIDGMPERFLTRDTLPGAAVGLKLAEELDIQRGRILTLTVQSGVDGRAQKKSFYVQSVFNARSIWFDRFVVVDVREAQQLYGLEDAVSGIGLWLDGFAHADDVRRRTYLAELRPPPKMLRLLDAFASAAAPLTREDAARAAGVDLILADAYVRELRDFGALHDEDDGRHRAVAGFDRAALQPTEAEEKVYLSLIDERKPVSREKIARRTGLAESDLRIALRGLEAREGILEYLYGVDFDGKRVLVHPLSPDVADLEDVRPAGVYKFNNPGEFRVRTWKQQQPEAFAGIEMQNLMMKVIFVVLACVFMLLIFAIMLILVGEKTKDIGILRAIGATRLGILRIFLLNGAAIGVIASLLGILIGWGLLTDFVLIRFEAVVQWMTGGVRVSETLFMMDHMPKQILLSDMLGVFVFVLVMTWLSSYWPAYRAGKIDPLETIRHEI